MTRRGKRCEPRVARAGPGGDEMNVHPLAFGQVSDLVVGGVDRVVLKLGHPE